MKAIRDALRTAGRVLTFRASTEELEHLGWANLGVGVVFTWIVGIGRWWDHPNAFTTQKLGLGSVGYIVILASVLWLFAWIALKEKVSWVRAVAFVSLTAPPGIIYAIPVERFLAPQDATNANFAMLGVVATYRVALLIWFQCRVYRISAYQSFSLASTPILSAMSLVAISGALDALLTMMGGVRPAPQVDTNNLLDVAGFLGCTAFVLLPFALAGFVVLRHNGPARLDR